jgi:small subunit ribosomal protein S21
MRRACAKRTRQASRGVTDRPGRHSNNKIGKQLQVFVRENNVDQALRILKKKMQREGIFREMKRRKAYEKPSERKTREKAEAIRRARKAARKQAQREGLIPAPKRPDDTRARGWAGGGVLAPAKGGKENRDKRS